MTKEITGEEWPDFVVRDMLYSQVPRGSENKNMRGE